MISEDFGRAYDHDEPAKELEAAHPELVTADSLTDVWACAREGIYKGAACDGPMLSRTMRFLMMRCANGTGACGRERAGKIEYIAEHKFDGLSISLCNTKLAC